MYNVPFSMRSMMSSCAIPEGRPEGWEHGDWYSIQVCAVGKLQKERSRARIAPLIWREKSTLELMESQM